MPLYVYECSNCGGRVGFYDNEFSEEQSCPECGEGNLRLIYSLSVTESLDEPATNCST